MRSCPDIFSDLIFPRRMFWPFLLTVMLCCGGCSETGETPPGPGLEPPVAAAEQPQERFSASPEEDDEEVRPVHEPEPEVVVPDGATWDPGTLLGNPARNYSLKEQALMGTALRREVSLIRKYQLQVQDRLTSRAEGGSEWYFEYDVNAEEALGGEILQAMLFVSEDQRRSHTSRERRPSDRMSQGPLSGAQLICNRNSQRGYQCIQENEAELSLEQLAILPQRPELVPRHPIAVGDSWQIGGRAASQLLGVEEGEVSLLFTLQQDDLLYRDELCFKVEYHFSGVVEVPPSQAEIMATVEGDGEYYYGRESGFILYHKQTQRLSVDDIQGAEGSRAVFLRDEEIVLEERVYPAATRNPDPAGRPIF